MSDRLTLDFDPDTLAWDKQDGLIPAIIQDARSHRVLMLGYMDRAALDRTLATGLATFYSRSRERLWTKGETSGHTLDVLAIETDCDADTLLIAVRAHGPTCHLGRTSCFPTASGDFLADLADLIAARQRERPAGSYTTRLFDAGLRRIAQKVGEEGVEAALAAVAQTPDELVGEAADLLFHLLVLLRARDLDIEAVIARLAERHRR